ncbi:MAG TPA: hypothetical protein VFX39_08820, partial [Gemmatimonadaceae bacterium]|nr:hypothetical protein [Gemmatimonadaceae bacterium]
LDEARTPIATRTHAAGRASGAPRTFVLPHRPWLAAAAALLLVAGTAGVTYTVTMRQVEGRATLAASSDTARQAPGTPLVAGASSAPAPEVAAATRTEPVATPVATPGATPGTGAVDRPSPTHRGATLASRTRTPGARDADGALEATAVYDREIAVLRRMLDQRRASLDTSTVRVLETNLGIVDRAIRESRDALLRDPSNPLLTRQLTDALDEKLEVMRTAVLVSSGGD